MRDLALLALAFAVFAILYKFRARIFIALRRFDARNTARRFQEIRDRNDRFAHFRHTLNLAEEEVEEVSAVQVQDERTGMPVTRYVFLGQHYSMRSEAEAVRREAVIDKAREFYNELDKILLGRSTPPPKPGDSGPALPSPIRTDDKK